jgi:hypothetical protein
VSNGHALFPLPEDFEGEDRRDISWIYVARREPGKVVSVPDPFPADGLRDQGDLAALFGGGDYQLVARTKTRSHISARNDSVVIAGPPKPLAFVGTTEVSSAPAAAHAPASPWMPVLIAGVQGLATLAATLLTAGRESAAAERERAAAEREREREFLAAQQASLTAALAGRGPGSGGGGGDVNSVLEALKTGINLGQGQVKPEESDKLLETLFGGFALMGQAKAAEAEAQAKTAEARAREAEARARTPGAPARPGPAAPPAPAGAPASPPHAGPPQAGPPR